MKTLRGACTTSYDSLVQHVLWCLSLLNPMLFQHFDIIYAFYFTRMTILNYSILVKQQKGIYIRHKSLVITATHFLLTGENIREFDVALFLELLCSPRIGLR